MFIITDEAAEKVKEVLESEGKPDWGLRIFIAGSSCCGPSYALDIDKEPNEEDEVTEKNGLRVFTDKKTYEVLEGMRMDFVNDGTNQGFVIRPDKPEGTGPSCSCPSGTCG